MSFRSITPFHDPIPQVPRSNVQLMHTTLFSCACRPRVFRKLRTGAIVYGEVYGKVIIRGRSMRSDDLLFTCIYCKCESVRVTPLYIPALIFKDQNMPRSADFIQFVLYNI